MAPDFAAWHDFFLLLGGACATLVGLLFVAVTFNIERVRATDSASMLALAERTFGYFLVLIVLSLVVLVPDVTPSALGITLLCLGLAGLARTANRVATARRTPMVGSRRWFVLPLVGFVLFALSGAAALRGDSRALSLALLPVFLFFVQSISESWRLLLLFRRGDSEAIPARA